MEYYLLPAFPFITAVLLASSSTRAAEDVTPELARRLHRAGCTTAQECGDQRCWGDGFTYALCCKSAQEFQERGCASMHFTYEVCCMPKYTPSWQCLHAKNANDLLWHCRMRPHEEVDRCFRSPGIYKDKTPGILYRAFREKEDQGARLNEYQALQRERARDSLHVEGFFASSRHLQVVANYIQMHFVGARSDTEIQGLCHGAKMGFEVREIRAELEHGIAQNLSKVSGIPQSLSKGAVILGTDISPEAAAASQGDVINWDFHLMPHSWLNAWDFIYSNALDHSYHPGTALLTWRRTLRDAESLLVLHVSSQHSTVNLDQYDMYGGSLGDYCSLVNTAGYEIIDVLRLPGGVEERARNMYHDLIVAIKSDNPHSGEIASEAEASSYGLSANT